MPMAASQYPATATSAGDRMTGPMIAMGCLPPTGDGLSSAGLAAPWPGPESGEGGHGGGQQAGGTRAGGEVVAVNERPRRRRDPAGTGCLCRCSAGHSRGQDRLPSARQPYRGGTRPLACHSAGRAPRACPASVRTGGVPAWV